MLDHAKYVRRHVRCSLSGASDRAVIVVPSALGRILLGWLQLQPALPSPWLLTTPLLTPCWSAQLTDLQQIPSWFLSYQVISKQVLSIPSRSTPLELPAPRAAPNSPITDGASPTDILALRRRDWRSETHIPAKSQKLQRGESESRRQPFSSVYIFSGFR